MRRIDEIAVHCAATPPSMDIGVEEIRAWHLDRRWSDIGYHFVIRRGGSIETGRPLVRPGAHVAGYNRHSIGVCLAGGVDEDGNPDCNYDHHQWDSLKALCQDLADDFPGVILKGHRDYPGVTKSCPCFDVGAWWRNDQ